MTCIIGIKHKNKVYLAADSAASTSYTISTRKTPKVFKIEEYVIGYTTSFRMGQLIQYSFNPPKVKNKDYSSDQSMMRFMVRSFIPALRQLLKDNGFLKIDNNRETGGVFLVGVKGFLFQIESDFQVAHSALDYDAVGSGGETALGSLFSTTQLKPKKRILKALQAAEEFIPSVRGPFTIIKGT